MCQIYIFLYIYALDKAWLYYLFNDKKIVDI